MSLKINQKKTFWKEVQIDSGPEHRNRSCTIRLIKKLYTALICDSLCLDPIASGDDRARCLKLCSLVSRSSLGGLLQLSDLYRSIVTELDSLYERIWLPDRSEWIPDSPVTFRSFKRYYSSILEPTCFEILCQTKDLLERFFRAPQGCNAKPINDLACFLTRANIIRDDLKWELAVDFYQRDKRLKQDLMTGPTDVKVLISMMREVVGEWFSDFTLCDLIPHHGPGAAAEVPAKDAYLGNKYAKLGLDTKLRDWLGQYVPNWRDFYPVSEIMIPSFQRVSKLVFVPKSLKTMRAINKIPITLMYWQQAVKDKLYEYMGCNHSIHSVIQLEASERNANLALYGSRTGTFGTIDLSSASDSVSYQLVVQVFADVPDLLAAFDALRCDECELEVSEGKFERFKPNKFAPMGEPLCFPIECIIFASCIEAVIRLHGVDRGDCHKHYNVYGDDMIVSSEYCNDVVRALESIGFSVNKQKSFIDPCQGFRESCGVEAYLGVDITPIRVPRTLVHPGDLGFKDLKHTKVLKPNWVKNNQLELACAYHASLFLEQLKPIWNRAVLSELSNVKLALLGEIDPTLVWWSDDPTQGWISQDADNFRLIPAIAESENYQRPYMLFTTWTRKDWKDSYHEVTSRYGYKYVISDDELRYFHWFMEAAKRTSPEGSFGDTSRTTTRPPAVCCSQIARPTFSKIEK